MPSQSLISPSTAPCVFRTLDDLRLTSCAAQCSLSQRDAFHPHQPAVQKKFDNSKPAILASRVESDFICFFSSHSLSGRRLYQRTLHHINLVPRPPRPRSQPRTTPARYVGCSPRPFRRPALTCVPECNPEPPRRRSSPIFQQSVSINTSCQPVTKGWMLVCHASPKS